MSPNWMDKWHRLIQESAELKLQRTLTIRESQALHQITSGLMLEVWERALERINSVEEAETWMASLVHQFSPSVDS
jgi:hypothetical protein